MRDASSTSSVAAMTSETRAGVLLSARDLAVQRGGRDLVAGIELDLHAGELVWLRGANGRGKTTLLRVLAGLAPAEGGELHWRGEPVARSERFARERLYLGHASALKDDLSALEALRFLSLLHGGPADRASAAAALERLGVSHRADAPVRQLSQGQKRRVALARLLMQASASLWILDEPFDALDAGGIATLHALLAAQRAAGGLVVLTSHQPLHEGQPTELSLDDAPTDASADLSA